jgi:hypothetical protein
MPANALASGFWLTLDQVSWRQIPRIKPMLSSTFAITVPIKRPPPTLLSMNNLWRLL